MFIFKKTFVFEMFYIFHFMSPLILMIFIPTKSPVCSFTIQKIRANNVNFRVYSSVRILSWQFVSLLDLFMYFFRVIDQQNIEWLELEKGYKVYSDRIRQPHRELLFMC